MPRINPFRPNNAVAPGMFAGRFPQVRALEQALVQTRAGSPKNFMLTGERGIGKTSLLQYFKFIAQGHLAIDQESMRFLVIDLDLDQTSTTLGLVRRIEVALKRELAKSETARNFLTKGWEFLQRVEALGVALRENPRPSDSEALMDEFAYSFAETANRITQPDATSVFGTTYDGVALIIDEADNASRDVRLGSFVKLLTERLSRHGCTRVMIGLAGMPELREVLRDSHPSSLRVLDELPLETLSPSEVKSVIERALHVANETNDEKTTVDDRAEQALVNFSEGYPHFIQQFGYSAFDADSDGVITVDDVFTGALGPQGAMAKIGDRYYRDDFYNKIQKDSYRQVLRIMADRGNQFVTKEEIKAKFKGKGTTLDNALHALRDRKVIRAKEGARGVYRLQHTGFAMWIKLFTADPADLQTQIEETADSRPADNESA